MELKIQREDGADDGGIRVGDDKLSRLLHWNCPQHFEKSLFRSAARRERERALAYGVTRCSGLPSPSSHHLLNNFRVVAAVAGR